MLMHLSCKPPQLRHFLGQLLSVGKHTFQHSVSADHTRQEVQVPPHLQVQSRYAGAVVTVQA